MSIDSNNYIFNNLVDRYDSFTSHGCCTAIKALDFEIQCLLNAITYLPRTESRIPAAIAEPITPATFGPMACMSRKLEGFSF